MKVIRVTEQWQRAAVDYVRVQALCLNAGVPVLQEYAGDSSCDRYVLVMNGMRPVSACRLRCTGGPDAEICGFATLEENRWGFFVVSAIREAEHWLKECGAVQIFLTAHGETQAAWAEQLGYRASTARGPYVDVGQCIKMMKRI